MKRAARRSWGGYLVLFMLVVTQANGLYAGIRGEALSQNDINGSLAAAVYAFVYGMLYKRKWVKWYILAALVTGLGVPLLMRVAGVWNEIVFGIFNQYWKQGLMLGLLVLVWEAIAAVIWVMRYGIGSLSSYISKRYGRAMASRAARSHGGGQPWGR